MFKFNGYFFKPYGLDPGGKLWIAFEDFLFIRILLTAGTNINMEAVPLLLLNQIS